MRHCALHVHVNWKAELTAKHHSEQETKCSSKPPAKLSRTWVLPNEIQVSPALWISLISSSWVSCPLSCIPIVPCSSCYSHIHMLCSFRVTTTVDGAPARCQVPDCQTTQHSITSMVQIRRQTPAQANRRPSWDRNPGFSGSRTYTSPTKYRTSVSSGFFFFLEVVLLYTLLLQLFCRFFVLFLNILDQDMTCPAPWMLLTDWINERMKVVGKGYESGGEGEASSHLCVHHQTRASIQEIEQS